MGSLLEKNTSSDSSPFGGIFKYKNEPDPLDAKYYKKKMGCVYLSKKGIEIGNSFSEKMQDFLSPLHIYCRMKDLGIGTKWSKRIGKFYEGSVYRFLSKNRKCKSQNP